MRMKLESGKRYAALALSAVMLAGCGNAAGTKATQAETTATAETDVSYRITCNNGNQRTLINP